MLGAALLLTACSQDDLGLKAPGSEANVSVNLTTPQLATRAYGDGTKATSLQYAVYDISSGEKVYLDNYTTTDETINISKEISFKFVTGKKYGLVFWADSPESPYSVTFGEEGASMTFPTAGPTAPTANNENLDAFYAYYELDVTGDMQVNIPLYRPFSQINVGTSDYAVAAESNYVPSSSRLTMTNVYNNLDLISGDVTGQPVQITYGYGYLPTNETFPVPGYDYLAMAYVLVPKEQTLLSVVLQYGGNGLSTQRVDVRNVPVQRNYRTNLYGQVLTNNVITDIVIEPDFPGSYNNSLALAALAGGFTLSQNETIEGDVTFPGNGVVNLNGYTITTGPEGAATGSIVSNGGNVTVNGPGSVTSTGSVAPLVVQKGGTMTITGGTFIAQNHSETVYIYGAGTVYITGGYFEAGMDYNGSSYLLNCIDANSEDGTAKFVVTGGTFVGFNPAASSSDNNASGQPQNWVPSGYKSVPTTINGKECWVVVAENGGVATNFSDASAIASEGGDVVLTQNITESPTESAYTGFAGIIQNGGTIDGNGNTLSTEFSSINKKETYGIYTSGGTIKNLTVTTAFRGIFLAEKMTGDVVIENCNLGGGYAINTAISPLCPYTLTVNNTIINGWSSWSNLANAYFNNCTFKIGFMFQDPYFDSLFRPYIATTFTKCNFQKGMTAGLSVLKDGVKVTFDQCTVEGTPLTASNAASLFSEIELPEGKTLSDVAIFK